MVLLLPLIRRTTGFSNLFLSVAVVVLFVVLLPFAVLPPIIRRITWRVRYRLIVTYFLAGILPIFLIISFVFIGFDLVIGQMTNYMLHTEIDRRTDQISRSGEDLAHAVLEGRTPLLREATESAVVRNADGITSVVGNAPIPEIPRWSTPGFKGVIKKGAENIFWRLTRLPPRQTARRRASPFTFSTMR